MDGNVLNQSPTELDEGDSKLRHLDDALAAMAKSPSVSKVTHYHRVVDTARRVLLKEGGCAELEARAAKMEDAGIFQGTDWATPHILVPTLSVHALSSSETANVVMEALNDLRLLAVAKDDYRLPQLSSEQARLHLSQVLALNLKYLFLEPDEAERQNQGRLAEIPRKLFRHLAARIGYEHIIDSLIEEIWRILRQRPIQVDGVKGMIGQIANCRMNPEIDLGAGGQGAERLVSSLYGPTHGCREDPGIEPYRERLATMDDATLHSEAIGFARAMHDTGLVSPYHPILMRHLLDHGDHLISEALGLSSTGKDCLLCYTVLVRALIEATAHPGSSQGMYGLALLLERGTLYQPPVAPALWRQLGLELAPQPKEQLGLVFGGEVTPESRLVEGLLCLLGQPLGVGQGNNPTCQSARALSMWARNDPDYLLQMVAWAARDDEIVMHFEGEAISSRGSGAGLADRQPMDLDPVSLLVVPHLDRIYVEMGRRCVGREGDPHRWVNPEFHGWWCGRGFSISVDVPTGKLVDLDNFFRHFYACYHPFYNGNQPLIHPQPAGVAVTDSAARFVGWHAITILRVAIDPQNVMRVYFYNPNNDSAQDWGDGVVVQTSGNGEMHGEASLPFGQFASRLYIFHFDPLEHGDTAQIPSDELEAVKGYVHRSWGADRRPPEALAHD